MKNIKQFENKVLQGDCIEVMKTMHENSVDTIITDPPYGLEFMGKEWDKLGGGIEKTSTSAGGFSRRGKEKGDNPYANSRVRYGRDISGIQKFHYEWAKEALRITKHGGTMLCFGGSRTYHRIASGIEDAGWIIKDCIMWLYGSGFPKATDISKQLDKKAGVERKVVGKQRLDGNACIPCKEKGGTYGVGVGTIPPQDIDITSPATPEAKLWNGWKSHGLKPAYEPILVAQKPNEGTYAQNALKYGVSGLNIEQARIPTEENLNGGIYSGQGKCKTVADHEWGFQKRDGQYKQPTGRFPANIILDEEAAKMLDKQSGVSYSSGGVGTCTKGMFNNKEKIVNPSDGGYKDTGGASRFFYTAKASKSERNMGCEGLEAKQRDLSRKEGNVGGDNPRNRGVKKVLNNHPTVKPLKLMEYLCTLTKTPTGGIVLDPFLGSGTTAMACRKTGRPFIGIEKEAEYIKIAEARIKAVKVENKLPL